MTILAATADKLRRLFEAQIARGIRKAFLGLPAGDVAAQAFGIVVAGNARPSIRRLDERIGRLRVRRLQPLFHRLRMAFTALLAADEFVAAWMRLRLGTELFQAEVFELLLVIGQQL